MKLRSLRRLLDLDVAHPRELRAADVHPETARPDLHPQAACAGAGPARAADPEDIGGRARRASPVASIATCVHPRSASQSFGANSPRVVGRLEAKAVSALRAWRPLVLKTKAGGKLLPALRAWRPLGAERPHKISPRQLAAGGTSTQEFRRGAPTLRQASALQRQLHTATLQQRRARSQPRFIPCGWPQAMVGLTWEKVRHGPHPL